MNPLDMNPIEYDDNKHSLKEKIELLLEDKKMNATCKKIIRMIMRNQKILTQKEIACRLGLSAQAVNKSLSIIRNKWR